MSVFSNIEFPNVTFGQYFLSSEDYKRIVIEILQIFEREKLSYGMSVSLLNNTKTTLAECSFVKKDI